MIAMAFFLALGTQGCAEIGLGGGQAFNDPLPTGQIVAQGPFYGLNDKTVSGTAVVYKTSSTSYTLRLSGVSFPDETGLVLIPVANNAAQAPLSLRGPTGNQNYTLNASGTVTWNQVLLRNSTNNLDYAQALLQQL